MSLTTEIARLNQEIAHYRELLTDPELALLAQAEITKLTTQKQLLKPSLPPHATIGQSLDSRPATL